MIITVFIKQPLRFFDRTCQVGALARDQIGIKRIERFTERLIVQRERTKGKCAASKWNQTDTIPLQATDKIDNAKPCSL